MAASSKPCTGAARAEAPVLPEPRGSTGPSAARLCPAAAWGHRCSARGVPGSPPTALLLLSKNQRDADTERCISELPRAWGLPPRSRLSFHAHLTQNIPRTLAFAADRTCLARHGLRGLSHRLGAAFALARTSLARARPRSLPRSNRGHLGLQKELTRSSYLTAAPAALAEREIGPARSASLEIHYLLLISGNYSNWM